MRSVVCALSLAMLAVVGCGDDGGGASGQFTVVGTEMAFDAPDSMPAGTYDVTFENAGAVAHELAFKNPAGEMVARRSIGAGSSIVMEVELEPGTWELGCFEPGHYEAGMYKSLSVTDE